MYPPTSVISKKQQNTGNDRAETALDVFAYKVAKRIGAYAAAMNGVDAIVFTAGLGENSGTTRRAICDYLGFLGVHIDSYNNSLRGKALEISATDSRVRVFVILQTKNWLSQEIQRNCLTNKIRFSIILWYDY